MLGVQGIGASSMLAIGATPTVETPGVVVSDDVAGLLTKGVAD